MPTMAKIEPLKSLAAEQLSGVLACGNGMHVTASRNSEGQ